MKIPFLPIYILTAESLKVERATAKTEQRTLTNRMVARMLANYEALEYMYTELKKKANKNHVYL